ncbi:Oidioi.mRNA.OKI2018_I69.chr2.g4788.t1.cds [Oikopleura dioica]|uniref:Oidioi.mRNA.OKI2018_I69.chr2.g4788.t1.cds n=1 Tax=Oikopleura dioica TaxID=34765 RepID=A0ABN7T500_OIKDI|nr:Oidioi.mRNA.OKI2018_I69.chr2.g4788.t1.cds [Oikopleura dioica]
MSEFESLMTFYNPDFTLENHGQYGCKCQYMITDRPLSAGPAGPVAVDELDYTCQAHKDCYRCAKEKWGDACIPEFNNYFFEVVENDIQCTSTVGSCNRALCECDLEFAKAHVAKIDVYDQKFTLFNGFIAGMTCPNYCGKSKFEVDSDSDELSAGTFRAHDELVNGRRCWENQDGFLITWDHAKWVIQNSTDTIAEGLEDVGCPTVTEWVVPASKGGGGFGITFNGQGREEIIDEHVAVDKQCCVNQSSTKFTVFNAVTHECCANGENALIGEC